MPQDILSIRHCAAVTLLLALLLGLVACGGVSNGNSPTTSKTGSGGSGTGGSGSGGSGSGGSGNGGGGTGGGGGGTGGNGGGGGNPPPGQPNLTFFGMNINKRSDPWPTQLGANFAIWRTLGADLIWAKMEPCRPADETDVNDPCYAWNTTAMFDEYMATATQNGQDVLYTAYYTPNWASKDPRDTCAGTLGAGGCWPPTDVESGDLHWKNFLTALYKHVSTLPAVNGVQPHIKYWECWNEPNIPTEYAGTLADLNILCQDLHDTIHTLDANTKFTSPPATGQLAAAGWIRDWIAAGYASEADYVAFHGYVCKTCAAETEVPQIITPIKTVIATTPLASTPMWDTEVGAPNASGNPDPDIHASFVARILLMHESAGNIFSMAYFGWDFDNIALINNVGNLNATLNPAGVAWEQVYNWTVSATLVAPGCSNTSGTIWECSFTDGGQNSMVVWDTSQTSLPCPNAACGTTTFDVPDGYTLFDDLIGDTNQTITGGTVQIGMKPIRLHQ